MIFLALINENVSLFVVLIADVVVRPVHITFLLKLFLIRICWMDSTRCEQVMLKTISNQVETYLSCIEMNMDHETF